MPSATLLREQLVDKDFRNHFCNHYGPIYPHNPGRLGSDSAPAVSTHLKPALGPKSVGNQRSR